MPDIYAYDNFRSLLADLYGQYCAEHARTTARSFAAAAGFSNPGFYNDVVRGVRKLSRDAVGKIVNVYQFNAKQAEFFRLLVDYGQEKDPALREQAYSRLQARRSRSRFARLQPDKARYYEDISYSLVRSAVDAGHSVNEEGLVAFLKGKLPAQQVRACLRELVEWGLVLRAANGVLSVADKFVEPAPTLGLQVRRLNRQWLKQAEAALDTVEPAQRHISTLLLSVSSATQQKILERIAAFRTELFDLAQADGSPDQVVQFSVAFFSHCGPESRP